MRLIKKPVREESHIPVNDKIEGTRIILDGAGSWPKLVIILEPGKRKEYRLTRTKNGGYLLN